VAQFEIVVAQISAKAFDCVFKQSIPDQMVGDGFFIDECGVVNMDSAAFKNMGRSGEFRECMKRAIAKLIQQLVRRWKGGFLMPGDNISVQTLVNDIGEHCTRCERCVIRGTGFFHKGVRKGRAE
jgi:hypothetical protein